MVIKEKYAIQFPPSHSHTNHNTTDKYTDYIEGENYTDKNLQSMLKEKLIKAIAIGFFWGETANKSLISKKRRQCSHKSDTKLLSANRVIHSLQIPSPTEYKSPTPTKSRKSSFYEFLATLRLKCSFHRQCKKLSKCIIFFIRF